MNALGREGGEVVPFVCPRCRDLPDRFLQRRISTQIRLNRAIIIGFAIAQLGGFWLLQSHMNQSDIARREIAARLDECRRER